MTASHARAERHFRALIAAAGIAEPDHVEYAEASVAFFWDGPRVAVVVDLGEDDASLGRRPRVAGADPAGAGGECCIDA